MALGAILVEGLELHPVLMARGAQLRLGDMSEPQDLTLLIGPEGGWTERELETVAVKASLGPRNLRADTAALVALATALVTRE